MSKDYISKNHALRKMVGFGVLTAIFYMAVFLNSTLVVKFCARGGIYAIFPIAIVFIFSFAHGAFANYLWQFLGIEAMKKPAEVKAEQERKVVRRPEIRRRVRVQA